MRRWLRSLERSSKGELTSIVQRNGSIARFSQQDFAECYCRNFDQMLAETEHEKPAAHPLQLAMLGAARWKPSYEIYTDGLRREPREIPDLSEP
jgi:hypothetical protein